MDKKLSAADREFILSLYNSYEHLLKNTIARCLGEAHLQDVEDVLMDVVYISCSRVDVLKNSSNPAGWLVNTAKFVCKNRMRRFSTEQRYTEGSAEDSNVPYESFEASLVDDMAFDQWIQNGAVESVKGLLSKREQELYRLKFVENRTMSEIAEMQKRSVGSVKVAVCRLKKHIAEIVRNREFENSKKGGSKNEKR